MKTFDPTDAVKRPQDSYHPNIEFSKVGIGFANSNFKEEKYRTLSSLLEENGDTEKTITYLKMDVEGSVWIDMAPNNVVSPTAPFLPDDGDAVICSKQPLLSQQPRPWRDHWMQALYFISNPDQILEKGQNLR